MWWWRRAPAVAQSPEAPFYVLTKLHGVGGAVLPAHWFSALMGVGALLRDYQDGNDR